MLTIESYTKNLLFCTCDNCKHGPRMPKDVCKTCTIYKPGSGCWIPYMNWEAKEGE